MSGKNGNGSQPSSEPYEKLLKGEISSKQYVEKLRTSVRIDRRASEQRSNRRGSSTP